MTRPMTRDDQSRTSPRPAPSTRVLPPIRPHIAASHTGTPSHPSRVRRPMMGAGHDDGRAGRRGSDVVRWLRRMVQRWGVRAVGIAVTGIGLYVVAPSLVTLFGAWPELDAVRPWWFVVLALLQFGSFAALWLLLRIAMPHARWRDLAAS